MQGFCSQGRNPWNTINLLRQREWIAINHVNRQNAALVSRCYLELLYQPVYAFEDNELKAELKHSQPQPYDYNSYGLRTMISPAKRSEQSNQIGHTHKLQRRCNFTNLPHQNSLLSLLACAHIPTTTESHVHTGKSQYVQVYAPYNVISGTRKNYVISRVMSCRKSCVLLSAPEPGHPGQWPGWDCAWSAYEKSEGSPLTRLNSNTVLKFVCSATHAMCT